MSRIVFATLWGLAALATMGAASAPAPAPAATAQAPKPQPARAAKVYSMRSLLAYEPGWYDAHRVVFFGNRKAGDPVGVYVWEPHTNKLSRMTSAPARLHSLAVAPSRVAFVQRGDTQPPAALPATMLEAAMTPQPGPETIWVQAPGTVKFQAVFSGWVLPDSLHWSPDGERLAFITMDQRGRHRLALLTPGSPAVLVQLDQGYDMAALVGWTSAKEVLLRAKPLAGGPERLLQVGHEGIRMLLDANAPRLSPDGRWLLVKDWENRSLYLRSLNGAGRAIASVATAYDWAPTGGKIYLAAGRDVVQVDTIGKVLARWPGVADLGVGLISVSPDGRTLVLDQDFGLAALELR